MRSLIIPVVWILVLIKAQDFSWPKIRFKFGEDTMYSFSVIMETESALVECTGIVTLKHLKNKVVFTFKEFKVHRHVALDEKELEESVAEPITLLLSAGDPTEVKGQSSWKLVDPRIIVHIFKYFLYNSDSHKQVGWENVDTKCDPKFSQSISKGGKNIFGANYDLKHCLMIQSNTHVRNIKATYDASNIKNIEYFYYFERPGYFWQTTVELEFEGYEKTSRKKNQ